MENSGLTQREITLKAMAERPSDPWPSGDGHVVLGEPGSPRSQKGYHEPGGLFSPAPGSFGVSFWTIGSDGSRLGSSEELSRQEFKQEFLWQEAGCVPSILTDSPFFSCSWSLKPDGLWSCALKSKGSSGALAAVFRSVGPAGGPLESVDWDGRCLILNHRWSVEFASAGCFKVLLGDESLGGLASGREVESVESPGGWGFARVELGEGSFSLSIRDSAPLFKSPLSYGDVKSGLRMELPSKEFSASLDAQAAHLLMGFVGRQTCPGEPTNYPLAWERDGAYSVLAMARAGQLSTAKELCVHFAENDFFGGFGAEADAPGSAINAIVETALISGDIEFQRWAWPHVLRKARLIREMLQAAGTMRKPWLGPIVPKHLGWDIIPVVCGPAKDGLVNGTMDNHHPVLYVSAVSCRGLSQAAKLAALMGDGKESKVLASLSEELRSAWLRSFPREDLFNERNFITSLWPTWTADPGYAPFREGLQRQWDQGMGKGDAMKRPLWTYFTVAKAHQWLLLGDSGKVWRTLRYFWANQCSEGLYSYWEGDHDENSFGLWSGIRGWVKPKHVTPHYWTAAEMLLLQLDMLAYADESKAVPELVLGAGVLPEWTSSPMRAEGIHTIAGRVSWHYDGEAVKVCVQGGRECGIRLGAAFGKGVRVEAAFQP